MVIIILLIKELRIHLRSYKGSPSTPTRKKPRIDQGKGDAEMKNDELNKTEIKSEYNEKINEKISPGFEILFIYNILQLKNGKKGR